MDITLWIVLGSLIGVVVIFIAGYSYFDRRKRKRVKTEVKQLESEIDEASQKVVIFMHELVARNARILQEFVPSIGALKMADIKGRALNALSALENSKEFQLIKNEEPYEKIVKSIHDLRRHTANTWERSDEVKHLEAEHAELKAELFPEWRAKVNERLDALYRGEPVLTLDEITASTPESPAATPEVKKTWQAKLKKLWPRSPHARKKTTKN